MLAMLTSATRDHEHDQKLANEEERLKSFVDVSCLGFLALGRMKLTTNISCNQRDPMRLIVSGMLRFRSCVEGRGCKRKIVSR